MLPKGNGFDSKGLIFTSTMVSLTFPTLLEVISEFGMTRFAKTHDKVTSTAALVDVFVCLIVYETGSKSPT